MARQFRDEKLQELVEQARRERRKFDLIHEIKSLPQYLLRCFIFSLKFIAMVIVGLALVVGGFWLALEHGASTTSSMPTSEQSKEANWIVKGEEALRAGLKDPESAQFQGVFFHRGADQLPAVCGLVNAKNSFGGYAGPSRFIASGIDAAQVYLEADVLDFESLWSRLCKS